MTRAAQQEYPSRRRLTAESSGATTTVRDTHQDQAQQGEGTIADQEPRQGLLPFRLEQLNGGKDGEQGSGEHQEKTIAAEIKPLARDIMTSAA